MKLKLYTSPESVFTPEINDGSSIVDSSCYVPQSVRIKTLLAAGQSMIDLLPSEGSYDQQGAINEALTESISDFADIADVDSILKHEADTADKVKTQSDPNKSQSLAGNGDPKTAGTAEVTGSAPESPVKGA